MAERDPFGRLPDENPLAGLGSLSDGADSQTAQPVVVQASVDWSGAEPVEGEAASAASAAPATPARTSPLADQSLAEVIRQVQASSGVNVTQPVVARVVKLVVFLVVVGVIASVAIPLINAGKDVRDAISDIAAPAPPGGGEGAAPSGLSSSSMLTRRNFDRAVTRLAASAIGRMQSLTIRPERVDAQLVTRGGGLRFVQIRYDQPEVKAFGAGTGGYSGSATIPFAKIDSGAPARLARSAAGRARLPLSRVNYVTLDRGAGSVEWRAYMTDGPIFFANSHGRITRRIG